MQPVYVSVPGITKPVTFAGTSWLFADVIEFSGQTCLPAPEAEIVGISMEAFGGPRWWAGHDRTACTWLQTIPKEQLAHIRSGRSRLVLDMSNEGQPFLPDWVSVLHDGLTDFGIDPRSCSLLQQNRTFAAAYYDWAHETLKEPMSIVVYDHFPRRLLGTASHWEPELEFRSEPREKYFCCMNFTPRHNRTGLVSWLLAGGFDRLGYISFSLNNKEDAEPKELETYAWFPEAETIARGLKMLRKRAPLIIDLQASSTIVPEFDPGPLSMYENSYFSLVTESEVSEGSLVRITEKSLKPILMMHPFLIYGNPGSLSLLREMGFETFETMFDQSYDAVEDPVKRTRMLMAEVSRILLLPDGELHTLFNAHRPQIIRNYVRARKCMSSLYSKLIEPEIIRDLLAPSAAHSLRPNQQEICQSIR